jgi:hypothetical protein
VQLVAAAVVDVAAEVVAVELSQATRASRSPRVPGMPPVPGRAGGAGRGGRGGENVTQAGAPDPNDPYAKMGTLARPAAGFDHEASQRGTIRRSSFHRRTHSLERRRLCRKHRSRTWRR